jgi:hypothetical protein
MRVRWLVRAALMAIGATFRVRPGSLNLVFINVLFVHVM